MIRELRLVPRGGDEPLVVTWDDVTGAIEGEGAANVLAAINRYTPGDSIPCMPECSGYTLTSEPRRSLPCMAAILHNHFLIPDWLMEHYPPPDEPEVDEGDEGDEDWGDLPVTPVEH